MKKDLCIEEAQQLILENICQLPSERVSIMQAAGRVLAEEVVADENLPPVPQSAVDGYALGDDRAPTGSCFSLETCMQPGGIPMKLSQGQAFGVHTGGDLPSGALAVIMHEKVLVENNTISILEEIKPGNNIKQAGEDYKQGETLADPHTLLSAGHIGLLAAFGYNEVSVYQRPRVALLGLAKNVIPCSQTPQRGQTRDSNSPLLSALINQAGGTVAAYKLALELEGQELISSLDDLQSMADLIILIGGTYADTQSEAQTLLESAGASMIYWGTDIQPGSHNGLAMYQSKPVFALSGNPAACAVGFNLFVVPALRYMQGLSPPLIKVPARCINGFNKTARTHRLVRGRARYSSEGWEVTVLPGQKPSMLKSLVNCNALIDMPAGHTPLESGQEVAVILLQADERFIKI